MTSMADGQGGEQRSLGVEGRPRTCSSYEADPTAWQAPETQFYGCPAELIVEWCCVAVSTAFAYKSCRLKPKKPAATLVRLHRDWMILTLEWRGWSVTRSAIIYPEGNETPGSRLRNEYLMLQYCRELVRTMGDEKENGTRRRLLEAA